MSESAQLTAGNEVVIVTDPPLLWCYWPMPEGLDAMRNAVSILQMPCNYCHVRPGVDCVSLQTRGYVPYYHEERRVAQVAYWKGMQAGRMAALQEVLSKVGELATEVGDHE